MADQLRDLRACLTEYFRAVWVEQGDDRASDGENDKAFSAAFKYSPSLVSQLRRGAKNITIEHLAQLAVLQGISVLEVLGHVSVRLAGRLRVRWGVDAPGSAEGSAVTPELADKMKKVSEAGTARRPPGGRKPPAGR